MCSSAPESSVPQEAKKYQAIKNRLFLFNLMLNFSFLAVLVLSGASKNLKIWLLSFREDFFAVNALYFFVFSVIAFFVSLPLDIYEGFILEHKYRLSRQTFPGWLKDVLKKGIIAFTVSLVIVEVVYYLLSSFPRHWWIGAAAFWFFVSVILSRIFPSVILPLFFKATPLGPGDLRERVTALLKRYNIRLKDVYVLDFSKKTVKANAMVAGLGRTKQIFLTDTLVSEFPAEEIGVIVAHEIGHYLSRDTLKLSLASLCCALVSFFLANVVLERLIAYFGFAALSDIAGLPLFLLILMLIGLVLLPWQNGFSRFLERRADTFALQATGDRRSFISAMQRLGRRNLAEFAPSRWVEIFLYDHPPLAKRIRMAQSAPQGLHEI